MRSWRSCTTIPGSPPAVLERLTSPEAIAIWAPVPFEVVDLDGVRLSSGTHARVAGYLAGRPVEFDVDVLSASDDELELVAEGPISLHVRYTLREAGPVSEVEASISVDGRGLLGRLLARATETLLAGGALRMALDRLANEFGSPLAA